MLPYYQLCLKAQWYRRGKNFQKCLKGTSCMLDLGLRNRETLAGYLRKYFHMRLFVQYGPSYFYLKIHYCLFNIQNMPTFPLSNYGKDGTIKNKTKLRISCVRRHWIHKPPKHGIFHLWIFRFKITQEATKGKENPISIEALFNSPQRRTHTHTFARFLACQIKQQTLDV